MPEPETEEVQITKPDGTVMEDEEASQFLKKLQAGIMYLPQY